MRRVRRVIVAPCFSHLNGCQEATFLLISPSEFPVPAHLYNLIEIGNIRCHSPEELVCNGDAVPGHVRNLGELVLNHQHNEKVYASQIPNPAQIVVNKIHGATMPHQIIRKLTPEEEELAAKRAELARQESQLADQELLLASLKAELAAFEGLYLRRVGVLYAELDEWNARLAELRAQQASTPEAQAAAAEAHTQARAQADEAYSAAHGQVAEVQPFTPSPDLKKLYREAAKRVHPDTATDEADRARRERLMQQVNAAYAASDEDALRRILANLEASPDAVQGSSIGADLIRVLRQLRQIRDRIAAIEQEIASLSETDLAQLKAKADQATTEGRDLLEEMATSVQGRVIVSKYEFEQKATSEATR